MDDERALEEGHLLLNRTGPTEGSGRGRGERDGTVQLGNCHSACEQLLNEIPAF